MDIDHEAQLTILRELLFHPEAHFAQLNKTDLTNDHFTFHLKHLIDKGLVEKMGENYKLTPYGLELAGRLDVKEMKIVRQPKIGVAVFVVRKNKGQQEILIGRRLKDPSIGKAGIFFAQKVHLGESLLDTAARCIKNEVGIVAKFKFIGTLHFIRKHNTELIQDVVFTCFKTTELSGDVRTKTTESENFWVALDKAADVPNAFPDQAQDIELLKSDSPFFVERTSEY